MGLTTSGITINRLPLFCQTIIIRNTISLNFNTISLLACPLKKTICYTSIYQDESVFDQAISICNTNPLHFLTLSLFFLPFTFFLSTIIDSSHDVTTILQTLTTFKILTTLISTIIGICLITYTTHQTLRRTPLTFSSTFKSLSHSFLPLFSTFLAGIIGLTLVITSFLGLGLGLGFHFDKIGVLSCAAVFSLLCLVTCGLAPPIAVFESKYGVHSLLETFKHQSLMIWFAFFKLLTHTMLAFLAILGYCAFFKKKEYMPSVLVSIIYLSVTLIMVHYVVYTVVLYVRAKAARGGRVVVQTMMRVSREDRSGPTYGWFSIVMVGCLLIMKITSLMV